MALDVVHVHSRRNAWVQVKLAQVARQVREVLNTIAVAFEVPDIHRVKASQRREQPPVGLRDRLPEQEGAAGQSGFDHVQGAKQFAESALVGVLCGSEAAAIDAVVDVLIEKIIDSVDFLAQGFGIEPDRIVPPTRQTLGRTCARYPRIHC